MEWKATFSVELSCGDGMGNPAHFCVFSEHFVADDEEKALKIGVELENLHNRFNRGVVSCYLKSLAPVTVPEQLGEALVPKRLIDARLRSYAEREKEKKE